MLNPSIPEKAIGSDVPWLVIARSGRGAEHNSRPLLLLDFDSIDDKPFVILRIISILLVVQYLLHFDNINLIPSFFQTSTMILNFAQTLPLILTCKPF
jgi:hypothetical protein